MKISLSRRYVGKACRQNVDRLRGMSTASISSKSEATQRIWSGSLSFASPESDFLSSPEKKHSSTYSRGDEPAWSNSVSFASPESDFVSASKIEHLREYATDSKQSSWSGSLSFASPESDFISAPKNVHNSATADTEKWSESLSFASPESDFVSAPQSVHMSSSASESSTNGEAVLENIFQSHHLYHSPETATGFTPYTEMVDENIVKDLLKNHTLKETLPKTVKDESSTGTDAVLQELFQKLHLYPSPETATGFIPYTEMIDETTAKALLKNYSLKETLPKTVGDALNDERPIVITTAESPFRVVDVNRAWEGLCGYSRDEAIGRNVGSLLQGPDTNMESANAMVRALQENGVSEKVLTNYAKNGRSFENRVQIGMIPSDDRSTSSSSSDVYFVGVLHDIGASTNEKVAAM